MAVNNCTPKKIIPKTGATTPSSLSFSSKVTVLKGVGAKTQQALEKLGITTISELLLHCPTRYENRTKITPINQAKHGHRIIIEGHINKIFKVGKTKRIRCLVEDDSATISVLFFNAPYLRTKLKIGTLIRCFGRINLFNGQLQLIHPQLLKQEPIEQQDKLTPIYPLCAGLSQTKLQTLIHQALGNRCIIHQAEGELPADWLECQSLPTLKQALEIIHSPSTEVENRQEPLIQAQRRVTLDALLAQCLSLARAKQQCLATTGISLLLADSNRRRFQALLPFDLTEGQNHCIDRISQALSNQQPMLRLLQGDVGSGKTALAGFVCFASVINGYQSAVMAPTELLATQIYDQLKAWFSKEGFSIQLLTGRTTDKSRQTLLTELEQGEIDILIGTHALIQPDVRFNRLASCVIDEQHRFGVEQRLLLREKGRHPHLLLMSATPIPRSLAMTLFGELDIEELKDRPKGRQPISTTIICDQKRELLIRQIHGQCQKGEQVFWVCPRISDEPQQDGEQEASSSEAITTQLSGLAAEQALTLLRQFLPDLNVGLIHGKMKDDEKNHVMAQFKAKQLQVLVATTVIEVGIDVPGANIIVIESAHSFGLSQLHQLRGRVGRGGKAGFCVLLYPPKLGENGKNRLNTLRNHLDGFKIAEEDLLQRGPGQWLGTAQSGSPEMLLDDPNTLADMLALAGKWAQILHREYPEISRQIISRWQNKQLRYANS